MDARRSACWAVPFLLASALAMLWWIRVPHVSASLYDLIGKSAERIPLFLREASASEVSVIVSSSDPAKAENVARSFRAFPVADKGGFPSGAVDFIRENRSGLVTRETADLLITESGRTKLATRAKRRLFQSPLPPVLGYADDPFGLTDAFLLS